MSAAETRPTLERDPVGDRLQREFDRYRRRALGVLRSNGGFRAEIPEDKWEEIFNDAWLQTWNRRQDPRIEDHDRWFVAAVYSLAKMEQRGDRRRPRESLDALTEHAGRGADVLALGGGVADPDDLAEDREDRDVIARTLARLSPLQQRIVFLRWGVGWKRRDVIGALDVAAKVYDTEFTAAKQLLFSESERVHQGLDCDELRELLLDYAAGDSSDAHDSRRAIAHLRHCQSCRAMVTQARRRTRAVAAAIPLPILAGADMSPTAGTLERVGELVAEIKQQAYGFAHRLANPDTLVPFTQSRGVAAACATACVAVVGGGVTYGVDEGIRDAVNGALPGVESTSEPERAEAKDSRRLIAPTPPAAAWPTPAARAGAPAAPVRRAERRTDTRRRGARRREEQQPAESFETFEQPAAPATSTQGPGTSSGATQQAPPPAAGGDGGEFSFER